ncbi:MAG: hypothetical protein GY953_48855, partial [bacterium]|nr:hypothetical protein [bacterium]
MILKSQFPAVLFLIPLLGFIEACRTQPAGDAVPRTLRLDYLHTGTATEESFELEALVREGPWPGPLDKTADTIGFGKYFFEVRQVQGGRLLYSRGFASIFGEYELTAKAKTAAVTFHESLRFPLPSEAVQVVLQKRGADNQF